MADEEKPGSPELDEATQTAAGQALVHAEDLLAGARRLAEFPHLAYHFGVLALEEVGRSTLIVLRRLSQRGDSRRLERESEDHVRKLFWALWGPSFGRELITGEQIEEFRGLAKHIHETRKSALYFDPEGPLPRAAVSTEEVENLLALAEARVGMARAAKWAKPESEQARDIRWFIEATDDPGARAEIMGGPSMTKLAEYGSVPEWIHWLREQFETAEREAIALAEQELVREQPNELEELQPKWLIKLRLYSGSHSVRPQPLTWWNGISDWIKFNPVGSDHRQLLVELTVPKRVPVHALWEMGFSVSKQLVLALNIGSAGFFWWYLPEHVSRYYERLTDLDAGRQFVLERSPALQVEWGHHTVSQSVLTNVAMCFQALPRGDEVGRHEPFNHYLTGLAFLAKTDVFLQFEANAFEQFYRALSSAMKIYGDWDGAASFPATLEEFANEYFNEPGDRQAYVGNAKRIEAGAVSELRVDLTQAAGMKLLTDAYLVTQFRA